MGKMIIEQLRTREDALLYYAASLRNGVLLENAFALSINAETLVGGIVVPVGLGTPLSKLHVVGLSIPSLGMASSNSDLIGHIELRPNHDSFSFSYSLPVLSGGFIDPFLELYKSSTVVSRSGAPVFIPVSKRPTVQLLVTKEALFTDSDFVLVEFVGCVFSYPKIDVNLSGKGAAVFTVTVSYYDCKIN